MTRMFSWTCGTTSLTAGSFFKTLEISFMILELALWCLNHPDSPTEPPQVPLELSPLLLDTFCWTTGTCLRISSYSFLQGPKTSSMTLKPFEGPLRRSLWVQEFVKVSKELIKEHRTVSPEIPGLQKNSSYPIKCMKSNERQLLRGHFIYHQDTYNPLPQSLNFAHKEISTRPLEPHPSLLELSQWLLKPSKPCKALLKEQQNFFSSQNRLNLLCEPGNLFQDQWSLFHEPWCSRTPGTHSVTKGNFSRNQMDTYDVLKNHSSLLTTTTSFMISRTYPKSPRSFSHKLTLIK